MKVRELMDKLKDYDGNSEVVLVRVGHRAVRFPEPLEKVMDGADLCGYDAEFAGKVALW